MAARMINTINKAMQTDYFAQFKQSLLEVLVMLACALLLIVLAAIFVFIGVQGGRYFLPMSAYQVTTYFEANNTNLLSDYSLTTPSVNVQDKTTISDNSGAVALPARETTLEYILSHQSAENLRKSLDQKITNQYIARDQAKPRVVVTPANNLYLLSTQSGQKFVGEFVNLVKGSATLTDLGELDAVRNTVARLQQNLSEIQLQKLQPLHKEINDLLLKNVNQNTPLYKQKLFEFTRWQRYARDIIEQIEGHTVNLRLDNNEIVSVSINNLQDLYQPNQLSTWQSVLFSLRQITIFLSESPKQAATSGGVFPAIFGTLMMVILMAVLVTPFGAISAIYLHEYAPDTKLTSVIRICVSNMAAVPSVVYGVFGLGFFVYTLGGSIDELLYSSKLPSPTFGAPGLLWAALTMGILTLPVVIVATEEGLRRVPSNLRTGALALGATKYETIMRVVLPIASPGILTGVILAIARAAGEVAPLILVGAVKFAPTLPIDGEFPFVHLERQFMHLGVFVYDGAFHNQTESQVSSLMFATCMLLLIIVLLLNISAILLRNKLRNKYERL